MVEWILLWVVLVLAGAGVIGGLTWRAFRAGLAVLADVGDAADRLGEIADQVPEVMAPATVPPPSRRPDVRAGFPDGA